MKQKLSLLFFSLIILLQISSCSQKNISGNPDIPDKNFKNLRVMTYNIHHANPPSKAKTGEIDLEAIANVIRNEDPDLVALQEVEMHTNRSNKEHQAEALGKRLGMYAFFGRAIDYDGGYYGVAILSKYPLSETTVVPLPETADPTSEDRVLTTAKVKLPNGKTILFGTTHLDVKNAKNREMQVQKIIDISSQVTMPFIVAGDFNAVPGSPAINLLDTGFTRSCTNCEPTIPVDKPTRAIDFIAFSKKYPFKVISQKVIPDRYASDHLPVVVNFQYE